MKVLFLDIDGVLNSERTAHALGGFPHGFDASNLEKFDHAAIGLIRRLCEECSVSIVLSSSWRILHSTEEVANGLDLPIFDATPGGGGHRGTQIKEWLDAHPEITTYAIVDDDSDMLPEQLPHFVHTTCKNGFLLEHYGDLYRLFGETKKEGTA